jgi:hypothetical protein
VEYSVAVLIIYAAFSGWGRDFIDEDTYHSEMKELTEVNETRGIQA